jgi:hypothetical protein
MLHRQPSSKDQARKSWEAILGLQRVVKERVGCEEGSQISWHFDCTSQEKAAHGHVTYAVQEVSKTASKGVQNGTLCPGNERCAAKSLPVRCRFRFSSPDQASCHLAALRL